MIKSVKVQIDLWIRYVLTVLSPRYNTQFLYNWYFKQKLNFDDPKTFNEKVSWMKVFKYGNDELVKICADKYRVRDYIKEKGCEELLIPLIGAYDTENEIKWEELPQSFALKLNVGCGCNLICTDKSQYSFEEIKRLCKKWRKGKYYLKSAEMQYKNVPKKIVIEECLPTKDGKLPVDYKFYCINGKCECAMLCVDREIGNGATFYYFDKNWRMFSSEQYLDQPHGIPKPELFDKALEYAERLSKDFPFVRVDLFIEKEKVYFGELTFTPAAGMDTDLLFTPRGFNTSFDRYLGNKISFEKMKEYQCR